MRKLTIDCDLCGTRLPLEQGKEAFVKQGSNAYHVLDLCARCLDGLLKAAESVNDTEGFRQNAAALIALPNNAIPEAVR
jgi:hypothetical protein